MKMENKKCHEFLCARKARFQNKRDGNWYCSDLCVPRDLRSPSTSTASGLTDLSSIRVHSGRSDPSCAEEKVKLSEEIESDTKEEMQSEHTELKTLNESERDTVQNTTEIEQKIQKASELKTSQDGTMQIRQWELEASTQGLDEALSASGSICDQSIKSMHGLLNDVIASVGAKRGEAYHGVNEKIVNAACNVAAQMANLMKMKLLNQKMIMDSRRSK